MTEREKLLDPLRNAIAIGDRVAVLDSLEDPNLRVVAETLNLLMAMTEHTDSRIRSTAVEALPNLVQVDPSGVVSALMRALAEDIDDESHSVRSSAAEALCALPPKDVKGIEGTLLGRLRDEENEVTRCSICEALAWHGSSGSAEALMTCVEEDTWLVRPWAAIALGWTGCGESGRALLRRTCDHSDDPRLVNGAAVALYLLGDSASADTAMDAALSDDTAANGLLENLGEMMRRHPERIPRLRADFGRFLAEVGQRYPGHAGHAERLTLETE